MKQEYVVYIAATLDGYIATEDHNLDWLLNVAGEGDNGYGAFYESVDTVIMGRTTYDWVMKHTESYPYSEIDSYVLTSHPLVDENINTVDNIDELIAQLEASEAQKIWIIGGGKLITEFIQRGLIDAMKVTIAPVLLGAGIPLFTHLDEMVNLELLEVTRYNQFVELSYKVDKK